MSVIFLSLGLWLRHREFQSHHFGVIIRPPAGATVDLECFCVLESLFEQTLPTVAAPIVKQDLSMVSHVLTALSNNAMFDTWAFLFIMRARLCQGLVRVLSVCL